VHAIPDCASEKDAVPGSKDDPIEGGEGKGSSWTVRLTKSIRAAVEAPKDIPLAKRQAIKKRARAVDIFRSNACGAKACVTCDRPWHKGETGETYQARTKDRVSEEDASLAVIEKQTKRCPSCSKSIEKNGGCHHMWCTCGVEFCWKCVQLINYNGRYCDCVDPLPG
jgi:hypothetical protein